MNLNGALSIASASLANINFQLGVVSNNVANANTPDYAAEVGTQQSLVAGSEGMGVRTGVTTRAIDLALQQAVFRQDSSVAELTTTTSSLRAIDAVQGTPGQGGDLPALLGKVQDGFSALLGDPSSAAQQSSVLSAARNLTSGINGLSEAYSAQRETAQTDIVGAVKDINAALIQIGTLSNGIIAAQNAGRSVADLENQRDAVVHGLGQVLGIRTFNQSNGDLLVTTASGTVLPTRGNPNSIATSDASIGPGAAYPGGIPPVTLNGVDITTQIKGGRMGADIALRDITLPRFQAELDEFAFSLASRFDGQGLTLFSDPNGNVPPGGGIPAQSTYVGFSAVIQVNPAVTAAPASLRDGTQAVPGSPTGPSAFTPNPAGGPASFSTLINRVLNYALGREAQPGVAQPSVLTSGLGPAGNLTSPIAPPATLADHATALVAAQATESANASSQLSTEQAVQKNLSEKLTATSAVSMDTEMAHMIQLQNAYGASARIITAVQTLFNQLLQAV